VNAFYFCIGFFIVVIFGYKLELLLKNFSFRVILIVSLVCFGMGIFVHFKGRASDSAAGLMFAPLIMLGYFCVLLKLFLKWAGREPINTVKNRTPGLAMDRVFAMGFVFGSLFIMLSMMVAAERLAIAGW
jgi:hypothetical protein